jgi:glycosyltransferase involved in cell wall biosynthesis
MANYTRNPEKRAEIDAKFGLKDKKVVLFTGRLTENKGVKYLIRAAKDIKGTVLILGGGAEKEKLENLIKAEKIKNVIMGGYINPAKASLFHEFYERADVYVSPSVWEEPLGLTILEAMAAGTPVVATKKGGIVSVIKEGENGFFVRARNSKQIAETVNMLLVNDELRVKVSENARKTIENNFTWQKIASQFEEIYKSFTYSTREYLEVVRGKNPKLSNIMRSMQQVLRKGMK